MSVLIITLIRIEFKGDKNLTIRNAYKEAFSNKELIKTVTIMSLLGMTVLGLFTYTGKYIEQNLGISVFHVGLILAFFGIGSLFGGRIAPKLKERMKNKYFMVASGIGAISLLLLTFIPIIYVLPISLFGFGLAFTLIQPMLVALAQSTFPKKRGTVMSLASFNMTIGGGLGTLLYGFILKQYDFMFIYLIGIILFWGIAVFSTMLIRQKVENEEFQNDKRPIFKSKCTINRPRTEERRTAAKEKN